MTTRFIRPMLVLGTTLLVMQAVFMPVGMVYAETTTGTDEQEQVELPPMKNYLEKELVSDPRFFFTQSRMQGTVEEPLQVTFFSDQEVSEARVFLPKEATLLKDQLPTGISVEEGAQPNEWIVQSKRAQNTFVLPLVVEKAGNYELSVEETTAQLEISEQEEAESFNEDSVIEHDSKEKNKSRGSKSNNINFNDTRQILFEKMTIVDKNGQIISGNEINLESTIIINNLTSMSGSGLNRTYSNAGKYNGQIVDLNISISGGGAQFAGHLIFLGTISSGSIQISARYPGTSTVIDAPILIPISANGATTARTTISDSILNNFIVQEENIQFRYSQNQQNHLFNGNLQAVLNIRNGSSIQLYNSGLVNLSSSWSISNTNLIDQIVNQKYTISFEAVPTAGGNPISDIYELRSGETTSIKAEPNSGYTFSRWEILSGSGGTIEDVNSLDTKFTMGSSNTVLRVIYERKQGGVVTVKYVDEESNSIAESEQLTGWLNEEYETIPKEIDGYSLKSVPKNAAGTFIKEDQTVIYTYSKDVLESVPPVDPLDPEIEVDPENKPELPENQGTLSVDFVSQFNFGSQAISAHDQTYYAHPQRLLNGDGTVNEDEERPNYVQVSDRRSENERNGWQLAVTQKEQFQTETKTELAGAQLQLMNQQLVTAQGGKEPFLQATNPLNLIPGNKRTLIRAEGNEGTGTWIYRFGNADTAGESVALHVPKGATPEANQYSTTLAWELSAVPGN